MVISSLGFRAKINPITLSGRGIEFVTLPFLFKAFDRAKHCKRKSIDIKPTLSIELDILRRKNLFATSTLIGADTS